jgi:signal transduction histidine kinase
MTSLQGIKTSSHRVTRLVEDFIAMAEYKTGEAKTAFEVRAEKLPNAGALLYEAAYERMYGSGDQPIHLQFDLQETLPPVRGDRERLLATFRRLIDILTSIIPSGTPVLVRAASRPNQGNVSLVVAASKTTLTPAQRAEISQFLAGSEEVLEVPSYGPSLSVVKWAIRLHDGRIEVIDLNGGGLAIRIRLPVSLPAPAPAGKQ